jgi:dephospho-CoA kinase
MNNTLDLIPRLALTGGIGSGKSAAGDSFENLGIPVIDSDAIAHEITSPGGAAIDAIRQVFGAEFINSEGAMDRSKMRERVFNHPEALQDLEAITHPLIRIISEDRARESLNNCPPYILFMIPLLFESNAWQNRFKKIVVVDCSVQTQIERVMQRNHLAQELIEKIIATQVPRAFRLQNADYVIHNEGSLKDLENEVTLTHLKIIQALG